MSGYPASRTRAVPADRGPSATRTSASLDGWASAVTPVPGGVGPVTVAELMRSTARAWDMQLSIEEVP